MSGARSYKEDLAAGLVCFAGGLVFYINVHFQEMMKFDLLGSKFFPKLACAGIMFFGGILALQSISRIRGLKAEKETEAAPEGKNFFNKRKLLFVAYSIIYFAALEFSVGFLYATPVYMFLNMLLLDAAKPSASKMARCIVFSVVVTAAAYLFFNRVLYLLLP
ncbi:MAG: tripartite tricarboxylate transporter TctB family protein [Synergistaceae bacterium]|nr:tripartite tricarboxylate transporter TctB family protein [Synergistaceae bacterium]